MGKVFTWGEVVWGRLRWRGKVGDCMEEEMVRGVWRMIL